jgi:hypothetical protein
MKFGMPFVDMGRQAGHLDGIGHRSLDTSLPRSTGRLGVLCHLPERELQGRRQRRKAKGKVLENMTGRHLAPCN